MGWRDILDPAAAAAAAPLLGPATSSLVPASSLPSGQARPPAPPGRTELSGDESRPGRVVVRAAFEAGRPSGGRPAPMLVTLDGQLDALARELASEVPRADVRARLGALVSACGSATIALGTASDPYATEPRALLTRALLEELGPGGDGGPRLELTTRSDRVTRDLERLREVRGRIRVHVAITTVDRDLARMLEPRAPAPRRRLEALGRLVVAGVPAGVLAAPVLPGLTDGQRDLRALICEAQAAGARWFGARPLVLPPERRAGFFAWLERHRPDLVDRYARWYRAARAASGVRERIERTVTALRWQYKLAGPEPPAERLEAPRQLSLFEEVGRVRVASPVAPAASPWTGVA